MHNLSYILVIIWKWSQIMISCETWTNGQYYDEAEGCEWAGVGWGEGEGVYTAPNYQTPSAGCDVGTRSPASGVACDVKSKATMARIRSSKSLCTHLPISSFHFSIFPASRLVPPITTTYAHDSRLPCTATPVHRNIRFRVMRCRVLDGIRYNVPGM